MTLRASLTAFCAPAMAPSPCLIPLVHYLIIPALTPSTRRGQLSEASLPMTSHLRTASCAPRTAPSPCLIPLVHYLPLFPGGGPSTRRGRLRDSSCPPTSQGTMAS